MMKLTINPGTQSSVNEFDKKIVVIGCAGSNEADLAIPGEKLHPIHLKIIEQDGSFTVFNVANDPFVTLNDLPFGKKAIRTNDMLQIGKTQVKFETIAKPSDRPLDTKETLVPVVEQSIASKKPPKVLSAPLIFSDEEEDIWEGGSHFNPIDEISKLEEQTGFFHEEEVVDVDNLLKQVEQIEQSIAPAPKPATLQTPKPQPIPKQPLPPVKPIDTETPKRQETKASPVKHPLQSRRLWIAIAIAILSILALAAGGAYNKLLSQGQQVEVTAMQGVADVVMALTYAQINNLKPELSNWSNPDFLQKGIDGALSKQFTALGQVDKQGQFMNSPYMLRIYTSRDLSRFLVIAQPEAGLLQWLVPKHSIVVDSDMMELRKISDLKPLNRVLVNANSLSGANGREVTKRVLDGELVPLSALADTNNQLGFEPPKALTLLRPGAEHLIYNAPRYSRVGEKFLRAAVDIANHPTQGTELRHLQEQAKMIAALPDAVLYTTQGMSSAIQSQQALSALAPGNRFLIALLRFDTNGKMTGSQLLTDTIASVHQPAVQALSVSRELLADATDPLRPAQIEQPVSKPSMRSEILTPISKEIATLLEQQNQDEVPQFNILFLQLVEKYLEASTQLHNKEKKEPFFQDNISPAQEKPKKPITTVHPKILGEPLKGNEQQTKAEPFEPRLVLDLLEQIEQAARLSQLASSVEKANNYLNKANHEDAKTYREELQARVLDKLTSLLLTAEQGLPKNEYTAENRALLVNIFEHAQISDVDEKDFYLTEFDWNMGRS